MGRSFLQEEQSRCTDASMQFYGGNSTSTSVPFFRIQMRGRNKHAYHRLDIFVTATCHTQRSKIEEALDFRSAYDDMEEHGFGLCILSWCMVIFIPLVV